MAYKQYNHESFYARINDTDYIFRCWSQRTRYGFRHVCDFRGGDAWSTWRQAKCCYYNRTWESFRYETVLRKAINKCPRDHQEELIRDIVEEKALQERLKAETSLADFQKEYEKSSPGVKEALRGTMITTEEEADRTLSLIKMANIISGR